MTFSLSVTAAIHLIHASDCCDLPFKSFLVSNLHRPFLLTGASGWFGRTALWEYEQVHGPAAVRRDVLPFSSKECWVDFDSPHGPVRAQPLSAITEVPHPRGLLHLAFLTRDKVEELGLRRYVQINRSISARVAKVLRQCPTMPVVATSSGAAAILDSKDPDLKANPYATLKQEEERSLEIESATRMAFVFRVYAASGRFMNSPKLFALGDFVSKAIAGEALKISSRRPVLRSYVHVGTLMRLCWLMLRQPSAEGFQRVDACTDTLSLVELAEQISVLWRLPLPEYELDPSLEPDCYQADVGPFCELLQSHGMSAPSLIHQIQDTALAFC
ncbi:MAG: NAD-dependent epimerase/dehydratase family protein [Synechococcaceae cyanobacterium ELA739]